MTKPCEVCGKLMVDVRRNRRFCGACMQQRRKAYQRAYQERKKATHAERTPSVRKGERP